MWNIFKALSPRNLMKKFNFAKRFKSFQEKPFLKVTVEYTDDGNASVDADFNRFFIHELDKQYHGNPIYNPMLPDNEKVALYLYDIMSGIAQNIIPNEEPEQLADDYGANIPELSQGGPKQTVDLANANKTIPNLGDYTIEEG